MTQQYSSNISKLSRGSNAVSILNRHSIRGLSQPYPMEGFIASVRSEGLLDKRLYLILYITYTYLTFLITLLRFPSFVCSPRLFFFFSLVESAFASSFFGRASLLLLSTLFRYNDFLLNSGQLKKELRWSVQ